LPLDVQVFPRNVGAAALEAGFTSVSLAPIDPAMFTFTPPADATVRDLTGKVAGAIAQGPPQSALEPVSAPAPKSVTFGNCVDLRIALPLDGPVPSQIASLLPYAGQLVSAMTVDRGGRAWLLVGFVDVGTLEKDAASIP
jgi:hypothetical protein